MLKSHTSLLLTSAIFAASAFAAPALAQGRAEPAATGGQADGNVSLLGEVIVTAQKREQNVQDVPISMTVISGEQVSAFRDDDIHSLQNSIPNLSVERLNWADTIYLRGLGTAPSNFAFDSTVSLYVDGVYSGRPQQFSSPFFDIDRIEVLRGPQGALFGKNTAAGAVSIVTANPTPTFDASVTAAYNFDLKGKEVSGHVSGPLSDKLSVRLSGRVLDEDGYIYNSVSREHNPRRQERIGRLAVRYEPTDGVDFTAKVQYAETESQGENQVRAPLTVKAPFDPIQKNDPNPFGFANAAEFKGWNGSFTGNVALGDNTLTFVGGYADFQADRANSYSNDVPAIFLNRIIEDFTQYSGEIRLTSPENQRLNYIVGLYYDSSDYSVAQPFYFSLLGGLLAGTTSSQLKQNADTYSVFGQATYNFTDSLRLIGSLRYTDIGKKGRYVASNTGFPLQGAPFTENGSIQEDHLDPSVTLQYDLSPDVMLYATYARGSKSGGFIGNNRTNPAPAPLPPFTFRPEQSESYEAGVKSQFADGRWIANVSLYNTTINDQQTSVFCATCAGGGFVTRNAGSATSRGVEASLSWTPIDSLRLSLNGAYLDAKYDDFKGANCLARQPLSVCDTAAPLGAPNSAQFNNLAGEPLSYASKWTGNFQIDHRVLVGHGLRLSTTAKVAYRSRFYNADDQSLIYGVQEGYTKIDARVELGAADGAWAVAVIGKNLTDEETFSFANAWPAPLTNSPTAQKYLDEPRTLTLEATLKF